MENPQPLVCPSHKSHYLFVFVIALVIGGSLGVAYGYQKGFDTAKKLVASTPMGGIFTSPTDLRILSGQVTKVEGSTLTIHATSTNPFEDPALSDRTIIITSDTKITKRTTGDLIAFQKQMDAFMKQVQEGKGTGNPPTPPESIITPIDISNIVVGDIVTATSADNIATLKSFPAAEIEVQ